MPDIIMAVSPCNVESMRFTAVVYADTIVDASGDPDRDELSFRFQENISEWNGDKDPYWCVSCDTEFHSWEAAQAHFDTTVPSAPGSSL